MGTHLALLEFAASEISALVCQRVKGLWKPCGAFSAPTGEFSERLAQALGGEKALADCVLLLQRQDYAILHADLPPGSDEELESMLELQIPDLLPLDADEIAWGWERAGSAEDGKQKIQIYWTTWRSLAPRLKSLEQAGLAVLSVVPGITLCRSEAIKATDANLLACIRLTKDSGEFAAWQRDGSTLCSRGLRAPDAPDTLFLRLADSLREKDALGAKLFCIGPPESAHALRQQTGLSAESLLGAEALQAIPDSPDKAAECILQLLALKAINQLGPASGDPAQVRPNLMPRSARLQRETALLRRLTIETAALIGVVLTLLLFHLWFYGYSLESQLRNNERQIARLQPQAKDLEAMGERIGSIKQQLDYVISPTDALRAVNKTLADNAAELDGLFLDKLDYKAAGTIAMEGHATNDITPWKFAEQLAKTGRWRMEQPPRIEARQYGATRSIRFQINVSALGGQEAPATERQEQ